MGGYDYGCYLWNPKTTSEIVKKGQSLLGTVPSLIIFVGQINLFYGPLISSANLKRGIDTLFNLLEACCQKDTPVELELESAYFFAFAFDGHVRSLKAKWEALNEASSDCSGLQKVS